ncbi:LamG-like jellyroll fold domain-containing protein [Planctomycetota bacterium]
MSKKLVYLVSFLFVVCMGLSQAHVQAGLVAYWKLDESSGTIAADTAGGDNDGTLYGNLEWRPGEGKEGGAIFYSRYGNTARVEIPTTGMSASEGTMMIWGNLAGPYPTNRVDASYFFGHTTRPPYANRIQLYMDGDDTILDLGLGNSHTRRTGIKRLQTRIWHHVALTWDSGRYVVYVDGEKITEGSYTGLTALHNFMDIGNDGNPSQGTEAFAGLLDEVRLYDHALTADEVRTAMDSDVSLQASWPSPSDGASHPRTWVTLSWMAGDSAVSHDVYFGENFDDVNAGTGGTFRGNQTSNHFLVGLPGTPYPDGLVPDTTYYWRIDEVEADGVTIHEGNVWRFSVSSGKATVVVIPKDGDWASSINALQPGEIGQLEAGRYLGRKTITVSGTPVKPIIIRGAGYLESIFDGESGIYALRLDNCSNLIIENITVTNPSPIGIDGRENYSSPARNRLPESDPGYSTLAEGMIIRGGGSGITIRRSYFVDIATRGIFVGAGGVDDLTVKHNIFIRVSDDTAGGDVAAGSSATRMTVRENLMAGNVDGIVTDGAGAGHIFERNVIIFHRWEDGIDIKRTWKRKDEDLWTIVRNNVFYPRLNRYSAISIQFGSDYVKVLGNVFHGTGGTETILIRGRNGSEGVVGNVENHEIIGNWFDSKPGYNDTGNAFRIHQYTADPSDISNVHILHNVFTGGHKLGGMPHGSNLNVYNNIFESTTFGGPFAPDVAAGTNLYHNTAIWGIDTDPIVGEPVYTENPVGPLAEGSPGKGRAMVLRDHDLGNDVGLPQSTENLVTLEISILQSLEKHFGYEEIKEAMEQGGVSYDDDGDRLFDLWERYYFRSPASCDPNADPDSDGATNREEYANGTDPLDPNSFP